MTKVIAFQLRSTRVEFTALADLRSCVIVKRGHKFCLLTRDQSRTLGCHPTYKEAAAQEAAIEISKHRRGAAEWDEGKHPRIPRGDSEGGQFAPADFPHGDNLDHTDIAAQLYDQMHGQQTAWAENESAANFVSADRDKATKLKHGVSKRIGPVLDDNFDATNLEQLSVLLGTDQAGRSGGYSVSAAYVDMWSVTAGDHNPMAVLYQHAVAEELGLDAEMGHLLDGEDKATLLRMVGEELGITDPAAHGFGPDFVYETMKQHAAAQYHFTQEALLNAGAPDAITLHRGMAVDPDVAQNIARTGRVALQPLSSFASNPDTALDFASGGDSNGNFDAYDPASALSRGHVISIKLPRSRIFSVPKTGFGCFSEYEYVVLGNRNTDRVRIRKRYGRFNNPVKPLPAPAPLHVDDPAFIPFQGRDAKFNPDEPRVPAGDPEGGQWTAISERAIRGEMRPGTAADRKVLGVPPAYTDLQVTDDPKAELVATARTPKGKLASFYSDKYHDKQAAAKWARIQALQEDLPGMLDQVNKDIADKTQYRDVAMTIRLIAQTGLRNGGDAGEGVGASNLRMEHVSLLGGGKVRLQFKGKGGVDQDHTVVDRVFAAYVKERQAAGADRLFPHDAADTLAYQKLIGSGRYKVHDLRTHVGTTLASKLAQELLGKGLVPKTDKEYKVAIRQIAIHVSKKLGNTPAIALSTYIHPSSVAPLHPKHRKAA